MPASMGADPGVAAPADAVVVIDGVTKRFDDATAVDAMDLVVTPGTIVGVIGPSGSGKTTTIRLLTGALAPTSGTVRVLGEDPRRFRRATRERIGYMPQQFTLYPDLTARENVDFVASLFGMLMFRRGRRTKAALSFVDLWDVRGRKASQLSGGMQRRLELACALVHEPALMFLDEPTAGIDPMLRGRIWEELHRLRDAGRTMLVTTQYVNEAESCDVVALISDGRLIALATPDELRRSAGGGDVVEIETAGAFDGTGLADFAFVRDARWIGPRRWRLVVDDAGTAVPEIVDGLTSRGVDVANAREERLTFDEVFTTLVERQRETNGAETTEGEAQGATEGDEATEGEAPAHPDETAEAQAQADADTTADDPTEPR
jgi:ABC-2 type transport system ATP-binding protein